jgi:MFS family permease
LTLLFCFNLSRGISSCAWLPWITVLVPSALRGKYLVRDAAVQNVASFVTFLISAACLAGQTRPWQFAMIFAFSAIMGAISLVFLKRIPDVPTPLETQPEEIPPGPPPAAGHSVQPTTGSSPASEGLGAGSVRPSPARVPWLDMLRHPPFRKLLRTVVAWSVAYGGITTFTVAFLKAQSNMPEGKILLVTSTAFLGGLSSFWLLESRLDRLGSKPVLGFHARLIVVLGWLVVAGRVFPVALINVLLLVFLMGLLAALVSMSNTRLAMAIIPVMGRNHFFAIYSVVNNVALGLSPIGWGLLIDAVGARVPVWLGVEWNRFAIFFAAAGVAFTVALALSRRLDEPEAASLEDLLREILIQSPQRFWLRLWPRG